MNSKGYTIEPSWDQVLAKELKQDYMLKLLSFLEKERSSHMIYPPQNCVYNAFRYTPYDKVRVVIVGQDPYHGPGQAHGLSFSVPDGVPHPPSLRNIFKELISDVGVQKPSSGNLAPWANQGVLLLNTVLTVRAHSANSHQKAGWERFTDAVIAKLCEKKDPVIFVLWGNNAKKKVSHIQAFNDKAVLGTLVAAHPSPLSAHRGFLGCRHFSKINQILCDSEIDPINWELF